MLNGSVTITLPCLRNLRVDCPGIPSAPHTLKKQYTGVLGRSLKLGMKQGEMEGSRTVQEGRKKKVGECKRERQRDREREGGNGLC